MGVVCDMGLERGGWLRMDDAEVWLGEGRLHIPEATSTALSAFFKVSRQEERIRGRKSRLGFGKGSRLSNVAFLVFLFCRHVSHRLPS
jgi:hypothetical protein